MKKRSFTQKSPFLLTFFLTFYFFTCYGQAQIDPKTGYYIGSTLPAGSLNQVQNNDGSWTNYIRNNLELNNYVPAVTPNHPCAYCSNVYLRLRSNTSINVDPTVLQTIAPGTANQVAIGFATGTSYSNYAAYSNLSNYSFIVPNGYVGIMKNNPQFPLDVNGAINATGNINATGDMTVGGKMSVTGTIIGNGVILASTINVTNAITSNGSILTQGNVGVKNLSPKFPLDVNGTINTTGDLIVGGNISVTGTIAGTVSNATNANNVTGPSQPNITSVGALNNLTVINGLQIGADNSSGVASLLNVHGSATFNNNSITSPSQPTQVSINTNEKLSGVALTVGGPTYIGSWEDAEGAVNASYLQNYYLWVKNGIVSEDFAIAAATGWHDNVFNEDYALPKLSEIESFIKLNKHLPGIPSESEVKEKGYTVQQITKAFLEKIENLVLYSIEQKKEIEELKRQIARYDELKNELNELKEKIRKLK